MSRSILLPMKRSSLNINIVIIIRSHIYFIINGRNIKDPSPYNTSNNKTRGGNWLNNAEGFVLDTRTVKTNSTEKAR